MFYKLWKYLAFQRKYSMYGYTWRLSLQWLGPGRVAIKASWNIKHLESLFDTLHGVHFAYGYDNYMNVWLLSHASRVDVASDINKILIQDLESKHHP